MSDLRANIEVNPCPTASAEPPGIDNPPGLTALDYRIGTRADFLERMLARLPQETLPDGPFAGERPLAQLATHEQGDPAVALLDTWATAADVLTFYQERVANESYLRTARRRRSVLELARLVGQELGPGVAAGAFLAFQVEGADDSNAQARVPAGTSVQSIPGQDEVPQVFETRDQITARAAWNQMRLRLGREPELDGTRSLYLKGTDTGLSAGDLLLLTDDVAAASVTAASVTAASETAVAKIVEITTDLDRELTRVTLETDLAWKASFDATRVFALRRRESFFGHDAPPYTTAPKQIVSTREGDPKVTEIVVVDTADEADPDANWNLGRTIWTDSANTLYNEAGDPDRPAVFLVGKVTEIVAGGWVVFVGEPLPAARTTVVPPPQSAAFQVRGTTELNRTDYTLSGDATGLVLALPDGSPLPPLGLADDRVEYADGSGDVVDFDVRKTTAHVVSEALELAEKPIPEPFPTAAVDPERGVFELDRAVGDLYPGQLMAVSGQRPGGQRPDAAGGEQETRVLILREVRDHDPEHTCLVFHTGLEEGFFVRDTVAVNGNVVVATHGETVAGEILGGGDGALVHQSFPLPRPPLTFLSAPVPGGAASTLEVRVDGVLWQEVGTLFTEDPDSRAYTVRIDDDGTTTVHFGDGKNGARLPSGDENVVATYRSGIGIEGEVGAGSLQLLQTRPLGVSEVTNPLPAAGAAPPDTVEQARAGAPVRVRTLGRIVSLADFEDFARTFAGIGKVRVEALTGIHLTIAAVGGEEIVPGSALYDNLFRALEAARLPGPPLILQSYERLPVRLDAAVIVDPRYRTEQVLADVEAAVTEAFAFDRRELAEPLYAAQIVPVVQAVDGVVAMDLDTFCVDVTSDGQPLFQSELPARAARLAGGRTLPAQLLVIEPGAVNLRARTP
ncbi:MAG: putative baseplate assembly protein [FCB group bacterium]|nr:putative baseplate assembly protein [FCB group bacterium]